MALLLLDIIVMSLLAIGSWLAFWLVIPWCQDSIYRYKLWELRDNIKDDIREQKLPLQKDVTDLLELIEGNIRYAKDLRVRNLILISSTQPTKIKTYEKPRGINPKQYKRLCEYQDKFIHSSFVHVMLSSLLGWITFLVATCLGRKNKVEQFVIQQTPKMINIRKFEEQGKYRAPLYQFQ